MTPYWLLPTVVLVLGYLLGSIPFGLLLTRVTGAGDLRQIGSGNIGATNVLRTGRKGLAAATLLLDLLKGAAAVLIGAAFGMFFRLAGYAVSRRSRDFQSTSQVLAESYDVIVDPTLILKARDVLARPIED